MTVTAAELDVDRLRRWLGVSLPRYDVTATTPIGVRRLPGGYSNLTFGVTIGDGPAALHVVLRRAPVGVRADRGAHDMRREYRVLSVVHGSDVPVPEPIAMCEDETVLGGMFFLMSKVAGVAVRRLDDAPLLHDAAVMRGMSEACIDALATLHAMPITHTALYDATRAEGYGARQVANWGARWSAVRPADVPDDDAAFVFAWLAANLGDALPPALLHNDWKFDNLLLDPSDPSTINGVLDWEMATVGDPRFDLATALGYWVQANDPPALQALALGVTNAPGCLTRREVVERYAARYGVRLENPVYWWAFGLAKVAVIVLQLYARYARGETRDERFAGLGGMAALLMRTAHAAIEQGTLEPT